MSPDGDGGSYLVLRPTQGLFDLLVALLYPHPQTIQPHHLGKIGCSQFTALGSLRAISRVISREIGHQVPTCQFWHALGVCRHNHQSSPFGRSIGTSLTLKRPPCLCVSIKEAPLDFHPRALLPSRSIYDLWPHPLHTPHPLPDASRHATASVPEHTLSHAQPVPS